MTESIAAASGHAVPVPTRGWSELWRKEDWWAVWLGLGIVVVGILLFRGGLSLRWISVTPPKWVGVAELGHHFAQSYPRYVAQFVAWGVLFTGGGLALGYRPRAFLGSFAFLYVLSVAIITLGQWSEAARYNLEPPLVALVLGLILSNLVGIPRWLEDGFRVEFYIKTGIVLLGATLPFQLILWAGPIAIVQASIVSIVTFLVIYWVAVRAFSIDRRFAATLAVGGAVCGVSAAIAIAGAVGARREHAPVAIATVIVWAIVMIFVLPFAAAALHLPAGVAGAWIGTSEFADAAGFAAAASYGSLTGHVAGIAGTSDQAVWAFTLMKVVGRDVWIGIWAFVLSIIATTRWEAKELGHKPNPSEIWWRFPKFVFGFIAASVLISLVAAGTSFGDFNKGVNPELVTPIKDLRTWAFIFSFLSIGLTTRFRKLAAIGSGPFLAFSSGVVVNVALGFLLSVVVFASYWESLAH